MARGCLADPRVRAGWSNSCQSGCDSSPLLPGSAAITEVWLAHLNRPPRNFCWPSRNKGPLFQKFHFKYNVFQLVWTPPSPPKCTMLEVEKTFQHCKWGGGRGGVQTSIGKRCIWWIFRCCPEKKRENVSKWVSTLFFGFRCSQTSIMGVYAMEDLTGWSGGLCFMHYAAGRPISNGNPTVIRR